MLELKHIYKRYDYQKILDDIEMVLPDQGLIAIVGSSGCGKSTLLHIIGGIDKEFSGDIIYNHQCVNHCLSRYRKKYVSFIFQNLHLIMWLSLFHNIRLPHFFHKQSYMPNKHDISDIKVSKISSLSFGQRQRLAYLRACYHSKNIILCDEPTGSLDPENAHEIMKLLKEESKQRLVIIVSHDLNLVKEYCDEIYEMEDGTIKEHVVLHHTYPLMIKKEKKQKMYFPFLRLSFLSLMSHKARTFQLIFGLSISLICVLLTLTMSGALKKEIDQYIHSLIPPSSISFRVTNQEALTIENMEKFSLYDDIVKTHLFLDEYELLGIGFKNERYIESETLFIGDDTSPYTQLSLQYGTYPQTHHDIMVSLSTAEHLCQSHNVEKLIGKKIYAWYKYQNKVISIPFHLVGITNQKTSVDTLYQQDNAYIRLLDENKQFLKGRMGLLFVNVDKSRSEVLKQLERDFPSYDFVETGVSTTKQVSSTMDQIEVVLIAFSSLALLSSLFLIGEVMFLNMIQKKKDFAIMVCFGASPLNFLQIIIYESFQLALFSMIFVYGIYSWLLYLMNSIFKEVLLNDTMYLNIDYHLLYFVSLLALGLVLLSQIIPLVYIIRLNTIEALKN